MCMVNLLYQKQIDVTEEYITKLLHLEYLESVKNNVDFIELYQKLIGDGIIYFKDKVYLYSAKIEEKSITRRIQQFVNNETLKKIKDIDIELEGALNLKTKESKDKIMSLCQEKIKLYATYFYILNSGRQRINRNNPEIFSVYSRAIMESAEYFQTKTISVLKEIKDTSLKIVIKYISDQNTILQQIKELYGTFDDLYDYHGFEINNIGYINIRSSLAEIPLKYVLLKKEYDNYNYLNKYLLICIDLEIESSGERKDEAYDNFIEKLNLRYMDYADNSNRIDLIVKNIHDKVEKKTLWKNSFNLLYDDFKNHHADKILDQSLGIN